jgi:glutamate-1-semialdehyde 2,1-aminomutase
MATQRALTPETYERASAMGRRLQDGIRNALVDAGIVAQVVGFPLAFHVAFGLQAPARNYRDLAGSDKAGYARFVLALLRRGVRVLERGAWFVSTEHDEGVVDATLEAVRAAATEVAPQLAR